MLNVYVYTSLYAHEFDLALASCHHQSCTFPLLRRRHKKGLALETDANHAPATNGKHRRSSSGI